MKLYLDEMISPRVAAGLRQRGHDVVTVAERGNLGRSDARQFAVAIHERRALVTLDIGDFSALAKAAALAGSEHWGIVMVPRAGSSRVSVGVLLGALEHLLSGNPEPEALKNRVVFLEIQ